MKRRPMLRLVSWSPEAPIRARVLETAGFRVDASPFESSRIVSRIAELAPAAVVIDLDRKPSHGKAVASVIRQAKSTRQIPLVFAGSDRDKAAHIQGDVPGAIATPWPKAAAAIHRAIAHPPEIHAEPKSYMEQWSGRTLAKKLDLKPGLKVALLGAPDGFLEILGDIPEGVEFDEQLARGAGLAIWFVRSGRELAEIDFLRTRLGPGLSAWIIFPKQSGRLRADFNGNDVRGAALAAGMVDYKICSVDEDWSGMKFKVRTLHNKR